MPTDFTLEERLAGFVAQSVSAGEEVRVIARDLVSSDNPARLQALLGRMQSALFSKIPGLPSASQIDHLLVVIRPDLSCTAYCNELTEIRAEIQVARAIQAGEPVFAHEVTNILSIDLGVEVPTDCAVVVVRSHGWRRSLYFDFGPLHEEDGRDYELSKMLAQQALQLIGLGTSGSGQGVSSRAEMEASLGRLRDLLDKESQEESAYQELLGSNAWMLGGVYLDLVRHPHLDDQWIPDFIAARCGDRFHDLIELKQPFLRLFRRDGELGAGFNDAWNQAEGYLAFCNRQRAYLREEKKILIENPRCILLLGRGLTSAMRRRINEKEAMSVSITVLTYDELLRTAEAMVSLVAAAGDEPAV